MRKIIASYLSRSLALLCVALSSPVAWSQAARPYVPTDVLGTSRYCRDLKGARFFGGCGLSQPVELRQQGGKIAARLAGQEVKSRLFNQMVASYQLDLETLHQVAGRDPWKSQKISASVARAQAVCANDGQELRNQFNTFLTFIQKDNPLRAQLSSLSDDAKDLYLQRMILARLELKRLDLAIGDNRLQGEARKQGLVRKRWLELHYPLAQNIESSGLEMLLAVNEGVGNMLATGALGPSEEADINAALGLNDTGKFPRAPGTTLSASLNGAWARRILEKKPLSPRMKTAVADGLERALSRRLSGLEALCRANTCETYDVSHEVTATLLNDSIDESRSDLMREICACNLSSPTDLLPTELGLGLSVATVAGVVACVAPPTSWLGCPAAATLGMVMTGYGAAETGTHLYDNQRVQISAEIAALMPREESASDRQRLAQFQSSSVISAMGSAALTAAGARVGNPKMAVRPLAAGRELLQSRAWSEEMIKNAHPILSKLTPAELERISREVVINGEAQVREVVRLRDKLVGTFVDRDGRVYLKLIEPTKAKSLSGMTTATDLAVDAKTGAVDANFEAGRRLVKSLVEENPNGAAVIFIDVNDLGAVNYFRAGQAAGDDYLHAVAMAVRRNLRDQDLIFKTGGDELVVVLDTTKPEVVQQVTKRMVDSVHFSTEARTVFSNQGKALSDEFEALKSARSYGDLPADLANRLTSAERESARADFSRFRAEALKSATERLDRHNQFRPSISIGSSINPPGGGYEAAKQVAEQEASLVKVEYKQQMGRDTSKYTGQTNAPPPKRRSGDVKPEVRPPAMIPPSGD